MPFYVAFPICISAAVMVLRAVVWFAERYLDRHPG